MSEQPPTEQDEEKDDCPICGSSLRFPALSRFDNKTLVCSKCGECEGTGFLLSSFDDEQRAVLRTAHPSRWVTLTIWQVHCIVINAIAGSRRGIDKKLEESLKQLREAEPRNALQEAIDRALRSPPERSETFHDIID